MIELRNINRTYKPKKGEAVRALKNIDLKFGDTGIAETVKQMEKLGAKKSRMVAKIAGGAKMFAISSTSRLSGLNVGDNNIESARLNFKELGIEIIAEDVAITLLQSGTE